MYIVEWLQINWGEFQHEAEIRVAGLRGVITRRYDNHILFIPPEMEEIVSQQFDVIPSCHAGSNTYIVEV